MVRWFTTVALAATLVLGVGFTAISQEEEWPAALRELVAKARAQITEVSIGEVKAAIDKSEGAVILDVREPAEYREGHLPGAILIPRGLLEFKIWERVPDTSTPIYVYCKLGVRSVLATATLQELGYTNVRSMADSYMDWVEAGYPVEK